MVSGSLSQAEGSERSIRSAPLSTYTERFYEVFPYYLSIGMTYEQFWEMDSTLVIYYRKAEEIRNRNRNQELWLQGMYIYEALCCVSPVIHAFAKKGTKPLPYSKAPYPLSELERKQREQQETRSKNAKAIRFMESYMTRHNKQFGEEPKNP